MGIDKNDLSFILKGSEKKDILGQESVDPKTGLTKENVREVLSGNSDFPGTREYRGDVPKSYSRILGEEGYHPEFGYERTQQKLAEQQSAGGQFINMLNQAIVGEVLGGTVEGISYLAEIPNIIGMLDGTEQEWGNELTEIGKGIKAWTKEVSPIYQDPNAKQFNPSSFAWWMTHAPSVASTLSLMIPAAGVVKGVSLFGKALGITKKMGQTAKWMATGIGQAVVSRHMENMMEASGVWEEAHQERLGGLSEMYSNKIQNEIDSLPLSMPYNPESDYNYTKEDKQRDVESIQSKWKDRINFEAKEAASIAASNTYKKQWLMLAQDIPQYLLLNKMFPGKGGKAVTSTERAGSVSKALGLDMNKLFVNKTKSVLKDMAGEGGEEMYQFLINEQSKAIAKDNLSSNEKHSLWDIVKDNYDSGELWTAATFGAIGAGVMQTGGRAINRAIMSDKQKSKVEAQVKDIKTWGTIFNQAAQEYNAALESDNPAQQRMALNNFVLKLGMKSKLHGDPESAKLFVEGIAADNNDDFLNQHGISADSQGMLTENSDLKDSILKDMDRISNLHDAYSKKVAKNEDIKDKDKGFAAYSMTENTFLTEKVKEQITDSQRKVDEAKGKIEGIENLSEPGQSILESEYALKGIKKVAVDYIGYFDSSKKGNEYKNFSLDKVFEVLEKAVESNKENIDETEMAESQLDVAIMRYNAQKLNDTVKEATKERTEEQKVKDDKEDIGTKRESELGEYFEAKVGLAHNEMALNRLESQMENYKKGKGFGTEKKDTGEDEKDTDEGDVAYSKGGFGLGDVVEYQDTNGNTRFGTVDSITEGEAISSPEMDKEISDLKNEIKESNKELELLIEDRQLAQNEIYTEEQRKIEEEGRAENIYLEAEQKNKFKKVAKKHDPKIKKATKEISELQKKLKTTQERSEKESEGAAGESKFIINPLNEKGESTGEEVVTLSSDEMSVSKKTNDLSGIQDVEDTFTEKEEKRAGLVARRIKGQEKNKGFADPISSLSWVKTNDDGTINILDHALNKVASDPNTDWSNATAHYYLDFKNSFTKTQLKRWSKKLGPKVMEALKKFEKGEPLTKADITNITTTGKIAASGHYIDLVDQISIFVEIKGVTGGPYKGELKLHASDYDKIKITKEAWEGGTSGVEKHILNKMHDARLVRVDILQSILKGEQPYSKDIKMGRGQPNTIDKNLPQADREKNVATQLGVDPNDVELGITKSTKQREDKYFVESRVHLDPDNVDDTIDGLVNPAMILALTKETINKDRYALKLNTSHIATEHAEILFEAMLLSGRSHIWKNPITGQWMKRALTKAQKKKGGMYETEFRKYYNVIEDGKPVKKKILKKDQIVSNLSVGETIDLLAVTGKALTDPSDPSYKKVVLSEEHRIALEKKRLYIEYSDEDNTTYLHYGRNEAGKTFRIDLKKISEIVKWQKHFIQYISENKTYAINLGSKYLKQTLNGDFMKSREFRIGRPGAKNTIVRKSDEKYNGFIIKNNWVTTDTEIGDNGLIFSGPDIRLNIVGNKNKARIYTKDDAPIKRTQPKPESKVVPKEELNSKLQKILNNAKFIKLSKDGRHYVDSRTGKKYIRVTNYISGKKVSTPAGPGTYLYSASVLGNRVDDFIRDFFDEGVNLNNYSDLASKKELKSLVTGLTKLKKTMDARGETVIPKEIVLHNDELGIAGTVDLITYDKKGKIRIYDMKTMRGDNFIDTHYSGDNVGESKYYTPYDKKEDSKAVYHQKQLSMYRLLLNNTHDLLAEDLYVIPVVIWYDKGDTKTSELTMLDILPVTPLDSIRKAELKTSEPTPKPKVLEKVEEEPTVEYINQFNNTVRRRIIIYENETERKLTDEEALVQIKDWSKRIENYISKDTDVLTVENIVEALTKPSKDRSINIGSKGAGANKGLLTYLKQRLEGSVTKSLAEEYIYGTTLSKGEKGNTTEVKHPLEVDPEIDQTIEEDKTEVTPGVMEVEEDFVPDELAEEDDPRSINQQAQDEADELNDIPDDFFARQLIPESTFERQDLEKEMKWVEKQVNLRNINVTKRMYDLIRHGRYNFALYTHDSLLLYEGAEIGTLYHEAFHRVSLGYLTTVERARFYRSARQIYKMPIGEYTNREVEEKLAEGFREYVLSKGEVQQQTPLKKFFTDLYNWIKALFTGRDRLTHSDVNRLYKQIYSGRFRFSKVLKQNLNNIGVDEFTKVWKGETFDTLSTRKQMTDVVKMMTSKLFYLNDVTDLNNINTNLDSKNHPWGKVISYMEEKIKKWEKHLSSNELSESLRVSTERNSLLFKELLGEKDENGVYTKFSVIVNLVDDHLSFLGIKRNYSGDLLEEDERVGRPDNDFRLASYEVSVKDNAMSSVKFMISTLHLSDKSDPVTGLMPFVNFGEVWERLMFEIHSQSSIKKMIEHLRYLASLPETEAPYYLELADKLENASEDFQKQFLTTFRKHKHKFIDMLHSVNRNQVTYGIIASGYNELKRSSALVWNEYLITDTDISTVDEGVTSPNDKFFKKLGKDFDKLRSAVDVAKHNDVITDEFIQDNLKQLAGLLNKLHIEIDVSTIRHYIDKYDSEDIASRLVSAYSGMQNLFSDTILDERLIENPIALDLAHSFAEVHPEKANSAVLGPHGNKHYVYSQHNLATEMVEKIQNDQEFVNEKTLRLYNRHSRALGAMKTTKDSSTKQIETARKVRKGFGISTLNVMKKSSPGDSGRDYLEIPNLEDYLMKQSALDNGLIPFPIMANRKTYFFVEGLESILFKNVVSGVGENNKVAFTNDVIEAFYSYYLDEVDRIKEARKVRKAYDQATDEETKEYLKRDLIKNYHYTGDFNLADGNAYSFIHFKGFKLNMEPEAFTEKMQVILNERLKDEISYLNSIDIIDIVDGELVNQWLSDERIKDFIKEEGDEKRTAEEALLTVVSNHLINNMVGVIESEKIFLGDPALFKQTKNSKGDVSEDEYKRWFGVASSGNKISKELEDEGSTYNASVLNTQTFTSKFYDIIFDKHVELYMKLAEERDPDIDAGENKASAKVLAKERLSSLEKVDASDGQVFISPDMYRSISRRLGLWPKDGEKEKAFQLLQSNKELTAQEELEALNVVLNPLKTAYMGHHNHNKVDLLIYDKMSMATIFRRQVKGTHMEEVLDRMELKGKYDKSIKGNEQLEKIDAFKFDSAVKVGSTFGIDMFENSENRDKIVDLSKAYVIKQNFDNLRHQTTTEVHDVGTQLLGTQVWKIASANIQLDKPYEGFETGRDLLNALTSSRVALSDLGKHNVNAILGIQNGIISNRRLISMLYRDARKAGKSEDFRKALDVSDTTGDLYLELDTFSDRKWVYSRIIHLINDHTIDLNLPGNQLIQVSDYGQTKIETNKELGYSYSETENAKVFEMEAKVSIRLFKKHIPNYDKLTFKQKKAFIKDKLNILGYRIPTQGQNSVVKLNIVELLPEQAGDVVQLPLEFTALTGSDFDIDKLFVATHHYIHNKKEGKLVKVEFKVGKDRAEERYKDKIWELYEIYGNSHRLFSEESAPILHEQLKSKKEIREERKDSVKQYKDNARGLLGLYDKLEDAERRYDKDDKVNSKKWNKIIKEINTEINIIENFHTSESEVHAIFNELSKENKESIYKEIKSILIENKLLPVFEEFANQKEEVQNTKKANENRILDIFFSVLSDEKHYLSTSTPLGALTDLLKDKADKFNELSRKKDVKNLDALRTTTPSFQTGVKERYTTLTYGIGPYALSNAHVALAQQAGLKLRTKVDYGISKSNILPLDIILGRDNIPVTDWLSALIDAHVDGVTDPYIIDLNVNEATYDISELLLRAGFGETTFDFIGQPVIKYFAKKLNNANIYNEYGSKSNDAISTEILEEVKGTWIRKLEQILKKEGLEEDEIEEYMEENEYLGSLSDILAKDGQKQLHSDINANVTKNKAYYERQLSILHYFDAISKDANDLKKVVLASRIDNKSFGTTPLELTNFLVGLKEIETTAKKRWVNLDKLISSEGVQAEDGTMLSTLLKNSVLFTREILQDKSMYSTLGFTSMFYDILESTPAGKKATKGVINAISEEMYSYLASLFFSDKVNGIGVTPGKLQTMMFSDKTSVFRKLARLRNPDHEHYEELKDNVFLNSLIIDAKEKGFFFSKDSPNSSLFLKLPYHTIYDKLQNDDFIEDFEELFNHPDPEVSGLARLLYVYSFYTSGFRNRMYSYNAMIPASVHRELRVKDPADTSKTKLVSFNTHIKKIVEELSTEESVVKYLVDMKREVFTNLWMNDRVVPHMTGGKNIKQVYAKGDTNVAYLLKIPRSSNKAIGVNKEQQFVYSPYVLMNITDEEQVLLEYVAYNKTQKNPIYRVVPKKGISHHGFIFKELGFKDEKSILKVNNPEKHYSFNQVVSVLQQGEDELTIMPLENQIVSTRNPARDNLFNKDLASEMREEEANGPVSSKLEQHESAAESEMNTYVDQVIDAKESDIARGDATVYIHPDLREDEGFKEAREEAKELNKELYIYLPASDIGKKMKLNPNETLFTTPEELKLLLINDRVIVLNTGGLLEDRMSAVEYNTFKALLKNAISNPEVVEAKKKEVKQVKSKIAQKDTVSSPEVPLNIYVDGSAGKEGKVDDFIGYGSHMKYNGKSYDSSSVPTRSGVINKFNITQESIDNAKDENKTFSNGVTEGLAIHDVLEKFKDSAEHLIIHSDSQNAVLQIKKLIQDVVIGLEDKTTHRINNVFLKNIVPETIKHIERIQNQGGSVRIKWIPGHIDASKVKKHAGVFKNEKGAVDQNIVDELTRGNHIADINAASTEVSDTFGSFMELVVKPKTSDNTSKYSTGVDESDKGEEQKNECK